MNVDEIVERTIEKLIKENMIRVSRVSAFQKTEKILYMFPDIDDVDHSFIERLKECLEQLRGTDDYTIIDMKYFQQMTHEEIAELFDVDTSTVTRRKNKIIKRLSFLLFPEEAIDELINE